MNAANKQENSMPTDAVRSCTTHCSDCGTEVTGEDTCPDHPNADLVTVATLLASDGTPLSEGVRVEGGKPGTDEYDTGIVGEIKGDYVSVGWDSCVRTWAHASELRAEGTADE